MQATQFKAPLEYRRAALINAPDTYVNGGSASIPLTAGSPVSPTQTIYPTCSGVQQYMLLTVTGSVTNNAATAATATKYGASNLLQWLRYTDVNGFDRHQIDGRGLELLNSARQYGVIGNAFLPNTNYGVAYNGDLLDSMPATVAAGATASFTHTFVIPFAYSPTDQRGAILANGVNVQQALTITFPTAAQAFVDPANNALAALYTVAGGTMVFASLGYQVTTVTKNLNLPAELPLEDFANAYILQGGARTGLAVNADFKVPFDSGKDYFNVFAVYDNGGVLNAGTDVNTLTIMLGGSQDVYRGTPHVWATMASLKISEGLPHGTYYKSLVNYPINTARTGGSADFIVNPSVVNTNATLWTYYDVMQAGLMAI
jgi:hypothetical protein